MTDPIFKYTVGESEREIKMTYGLLDMLCRECGDIEGAFEVATDNGLRAAVLNQIFAKRDARGNIEEPFNPFDLELDPNQVNDLLEWVGAHVTDFFLKGYEKAASTGERNKEPIQRLKDLQSSLSGGAD